MCSSPFSCAYPLLTQARPLGPITRSSCRRARFCLSASSLHNLFLRNTGTSYRTAVARPGMLFCSLRFYSRVARPLRCYLVAAARHLVRSLKQCFRGMSRCDAAIPLPLVDILWCCNLIIMCKSRFSRGTGVRRGYSPLNLLRYGGVDWAADLGFHRFRDVEDSGR